MLAILRERIAACLPRGRLARGIVALASGTAAAQAITVCMMPIVTRLYTPAQIGVISLFLAFFGFWSATLSLRYEYALLIARDDEESHVVHRLAVVLVVVMSVLGLPILLGLQRTGMLGFELLPNWAPFAAVPILLGYGIFMVYRSWALRAGTVNDITKATIARSAANAGTRVALGLFGGGTIALFAAEFAGAWGAMLELARNARKHFASSKPISIRRCDLVGVARRFSKFPAFETPSTWVNQLALTLPLPMVASLHGAAAAGWFGLARAMVGIPNTQIGSAVADVFQMELASALVAGEAARARGLFYKLMRKLALFGLVPLVAVIVLGPWLVPWIFGQKWKAAGWAAAIIAPWLYAALVVSSLSRTLSVIQAQEYKFVYDVGAASLFILAFFVAKYTHPSFLELVSILSGTGVLSYIIYLVLLVVVVEAQLETR
ncbi:oligosaccharide flippase family protein [Fulvimonas sp. R45]|uniref:lipopolysaccharide biosynthesis protein n=1 Tax=Fulvimonas sp. R45 TaxID=3045937 RepID=UPI00265FC9EE|nr:oligosaccharide flippase family protein [Fulvimonas sp. R45]MDO1528143.1 oligosaccharide flippase family protein [Fulvimonas sp. R45]